MSTFLPAEKGMTIRMPSTANLMIDSADRNEARFPSPWNFQITKTQSILNGFFTRIATAEVVLEWNVPNGAYLYSLPSISMTWATGPATQTIPIFSNQTQFYTAELALNELAEACNTAFSTTVFEVVETNGLVALQTSDNSDFSMVPNATTRALGFNDVEAALSVPAHQVYDPDLRPFRFIDFVSAELTYNQDLKDASTNNQNRDVLCRWYFSWDQPPQLDAYGFPILMGYTPFYLRRLYNPPKQIRWDNIQPLGNLSFQVYDNTGALLQDMAEFSNGSAEWLMTLQISEC